VSGNFSGVPCLLVGTHLDSTTDTAVLTGVGYRQVVGLWLSNLTSSDKTADVSWYSKNDDDAYDLLKGHTVPANGNVWLPLEAFSLGKDDELRVKASAADAIDVIVSIAELPGRST
jgi:hypothetical protein